MSRFEPVDLDHPEFGDLYDELSLWSAPFGLLLLDRVPLRPGLTVLDVGAGTGFLTVELAQRCGPEATVIAVDPWKAGMDRLRRKLGYLGLGNVRLLEQDAAAIELPAESIDVVVSNLGINNFEDPGAVLSACFRVCRPGAAVLLTTNLTGHMAEFYDVFRETLIELGQADRLPALESHVRHRGTVDSVGRLLRSAGFEVSHMEARSFRMRFADGSALLRHHFIRMGFVPGWISVVDPGKTEPTFEALERNLNAAAARRGELALTIPMLCAEAIRPGQKP